MELSANLYTRLGAGEFCIVTVVEVYKPERLFIVFNMPMYQLSNMGNNSAQYRDYIFAKIQEGWVKRYMNEVIVDDRPAWWLHVVRCDCNEVNTDPRVMHKDPTIYPTVELT